MIIEELNDMDGPAQLESDHLNALWYDLHGDWDTFPGKIAFDEEVSFILSELP
jgi:hypothetical protein